jgi:exosortase
MTHEPGTSPSGASPAQLPANNAARGEAVRNSPRFRYDEPLGAASAMALTAEGGEIPALPLEWGRIWLALAVVGALLGVLYFASVQFLTIQWYSDASWSHGFAVPLIAVFFIRLKWDLLKQLPVRGSWIGLPVLLAGILGQVLFRATGVMHMSNLSMLPTLYGLVLFVFGWDHLKILWLPVSYLAFMIPPPSPLYVAATTPMQELAAKIGVLLCPLFGVSAIRMGTVIQVTRGAVTESLNVAEACSGMRMLIAFFALAVLLAYRTSRPMWQKVFLAGCALPIAILCNSLRVALTGVLVIYGGKQWGHGSTHEYVGLLMLGPALVMQLGVAWALDMAFIEEPEDAAANPGDSAGGVGGTGAGGAA